MSPPKIRLDELKIERKTGDEKFTFKGEQVQGATILDFWKWYGSDLVNNALRGNLAEYIVELALGQKDSIQIGWAPYDLSYKGIKIEVKSSAFIQSWFQKDHSKISFNISKTKGWDSKTNEYSDRIARQADIYVFALLDHINQDSIDPMNLEQWTFYVINTETIDKRLKDAKSAGISTLERIGAVKCTFDEIKTNIEDIML